MDTDSSHQTSKKITKQTLLFVVAIFLIATILRTPLTVVGPVIPFIREDLGISNALAGFLTTIPLLAFAVISPFAAPIARKFGMERTLFYSVLLLLAGIVLRSLGMTLLLITGTVLIGVAIAFANVLIPSYFKLKFPLHIGLLMGIYTVSMNASAGLAVGISHPIAMSSFGWQGALGFSVILCITTLIAWFPLLRNNKAETMAPGIKQPRTKLSRSWLAWTVALTMGLQSFFFYSLATWLPEILVSQGMQPENAGWMVTIMQLSQIPMTFIVPIIAGKLSSQRPITLFFVICYLIGFTGLMMEWTSSVVIWMIFLGFAGGASFSLCMMLFTLRTNTAYEAAELSGFAQSIGYLLAAIGPIALGYIHDAMNGWHIPNVIFIVVTILLLITSMISSQNRKI
ncbi:CynX/NimT family MFS transporter [Bacillus ndiopicus]|uniref:CynX/NimT family MFS transporter n=1 Tax=Bacillus ndiopicus TaxID=1347368 RepID=UPI0005A65946|nr:MFS transporter [Bacillus ndiopicus]